MEDTSWGCVECKCSKVGNPWSRWIPNHETELVIGLEGSLASGTWAKAVSWDSNGELGEWKEGEPEGSLSYCFKKIHWEGKAKRLRKLSEWL